LLSIPEGGIEYSDLIFFHADCRLVTGLFYSFRQFIANSRKQKTPLPFSRQWGFRNLSDYAKTRLPLCSAAELRLEAAGWSN
jgi:hypothetical protein